MQIEKEFIFDSAHFLPLVTEDHKCRKLHGHTYRVTIAVSGEVNSQGWIIDFAEISDVVKPILRSIDHTLLKPDATRAEIEHLCREAAQFKFATVCVNPAMGADRDGAS